MQHASLPAVGLALMAVAACYPKSAAHTQRLGDEARRVEAARSEAKPYQVGEMRLGERHGPWEWFDAEGQLWKAEIYDRGFRISERVFGDGHPKSESTWYESTANAAVPDGVWRQWNDAGALIRVESYAEGRRHGLWETHVADGRLASRGIYEAGHKAGEWTWWTSDGTVALIYAFSGPDDPGPDRDCTDTEACRNQGRCNNHRGDCTKLSREQCKYACETAGKCTPSEGSCYAAVDADCNGSSPCTEHGFCEAQGGSCSAPATMCEQTPECLAKGKCSVQGTGGQSHRSTLSTARLDPTTR